MKKLIVVILILFASAAQAVSNEDVVFAQTVNACRTTQQEGTYSAVMTCAKKYPLKTEEQAYGRAGCERRLMKKVDAAFEACVAPVLKKKE